MNFKKVSINRDLSLKSSFGFTLIEILIVIGIIAILAAIVIVAINPAKQFAQARNTQRAANVNANWNAISQRSADNKGIFAGAFDVGGITYTCGPIPSTQTTINTTMAANIISDTGNMGCLIPTYMSAFPVDPTLPPVPSTGYEASVSLTGRVKVCSPLAATENSIPGVTTVCVER